MSAIRSWANMLAGLLAAFLFAALVAWQLGRDAGTWWGRAVCALVALVFAGAAVAAAEADQRARRAARERTRA